jgi:uncharacterized membrane protein HdeD (DUF308 family)
MQIMDLTITNRVLAILAIVFGIIVMVAPVVLAYLIGVYLIIVGALYFVKEYRK